RALQVFPEGRGGNGGGRRGKQSAGEGAHQYRRGSGKTYSKAAGIVRSSSGAGDAAGDGPDHPARGCGPVIAGVQDERCGAWIARFTPRVESSKPAGFEDSTRGVGLP